MPIYAVTPDGGNLSLFFHVSTFQSLISASVHEAAIYDLFKLENITTE